MTNANATHIGWTAEMKYQSAERKMTTGDSVIRDGAGEYIGTVLNAYAALVAAAPDLLAACKMALTEAEGWAHDQLDGTKQIGAALDALEPIRAAIRKAEGSIRP